VEAGAAYARLRGLAPRLFDAHHLGGVVALQQGRHAEAATLLEQACRLNPADAVCRMRLGLAWLGAGRVSDGLAALEALVKAQPAMAAAWDNLGYARKLANDLAGGIAAHRKAVKLDPRNAPAWHNLGLSLAMAGEPAEAQRCHERALALDPDHVRAGSARLLMMQYDDGIPRAARFAAHREQGERLRRRAGSVAPRAFPPAVPARLRVGFLSPDLRQHSVAHFIAPLLAHLPREAFELCLYHDHASEDAISARLKDVASRWRNVAACSDEALEKIIREDAPHILVDLNAHTGRSRLAVFARRVAPVQITYLGYPDTTGLAEMDFRLTDARADPPGEAEAWHTETLIRFSECAWAWEPPSDAPDVPPLPSAAGGGFTFGSFNHLAKLNAGTLALWSRVLAAVPDSRLVLKSMGLDIPATASALRDRLAAVGIDPTRVEVLGPTAGIADHLALYRKIDVTLDPYPYHGTTTTCEALWMGRPVVSLAGDRHASRVGASLLSAVNRPGWIASTPEDYVAIAARLARSRAPEDLGGPTLREAVAASLLLDHAGQARRFGESLRGALAHAIAGRTPAASA
jgi:predicted O-linked N-acetylglucosamine transferase (SPINDLY family)